jgi:hypothetical protein
MLEQDDPTFPNWDQDATAIADRYQDQEPAVVAGQLREAADRIAGRFAGLSPDQWERTGTRSDGARFTLDRAAGIALRPPAACYVRA